MENDKINEYLLQHQCHMKEKYSRQEKELKKWKYPNAFQDYSYNTDKKGFCIEN